MKIDPFHSSRTRAQRGSAVLVLTLFLSTMILMVAATTQSAIWLRAEIHLVERRQIERWQRLSNEAARPATPPPTPSSAP